jgi:hypothetical protein
MRATAIGMLLGTMLFAGPASAYDPYDPNNCNGVDYDDKRIVVVSQVTAHPRVNFVKSPYDDDFKAATCPAATDACRRAAYLVTGDLVLTGKTRGAFTCVNYQSPLATKQIWAKGWLPSAALMPVAPMPSPKIPDWLGTWYHPGGSIVIKTGDGGKLHVEGEMGLPMPSGDVQNGNFRAQVTPRGDTLTFADEDGYGDECHVRMQRIGPWLLVEDNGGCGGSGVTFIGLYHRTN